MLEFSDAPYNFFEANPLAPLINLGRLTNQHFILSGANHRITQLALRGEITALREANYAQNRLLFVINHPSHSDPQILTEAQRVLGIDSCYMAAYDVFLRSKFHAWYMTRMGNFSVDREGNDRRAISTAIRILASGKCALNIFPEGNVYLKNDQLMPFLDGAAFIALKAQAALDDKPLKIIPVSIKLTHLTTPRDLITTRMLQLARDSAYSFPVGSHADPLVAVLGLGRHILSGKLVQHGLAGRLPQDDSSLHQLIEHFTADLVTQMESTLNIPANKTPTLLSRISRIRTSIHHLRTAPSTASSLHLHSLAEKSILALRIHGYLSPYLSEYPSIDRYDETVERISEDFYSRTMPRTGPRRALVNFGSPLDVTEYMNLKSREALSQITHKLQQNVQLGIHYLNLENQAPGAQLVS